MANADRPHLAVLGDLDRVAIAVGEFTVREAQHPKGRAVADGDVGDPELGAAVRLAQRPPAASLVAAGLARGSGHGARGVVGHRAEVGSSSDGWAQATVQSRIALVSAASFVVFT